MIRTALAGLRRLRDDQADRPVPTIGALAAIASIGIGTYLLGKYVTQQQAALVDGGLRVFLLRKELAAQRAEAWQLDEALSEDPTPTDTVPYPAPEDLNPLAGREVVDGE